MMYTITVLLNFGLILTGSMLVYVTSRVVCLTLLFWYFEDVDGFIVGCHGWHYFQSDYYSNASDRVGIYVTSHQ